MRNPENSSPAHIYEEYLGRSIAAPFTRVLLEYAAPKRGESVLDLASGTGSVARHLAPIVGTEGRIIAIDINPEMLAVGRKVAAPAGATIEWVQGDAVALGFPDNEFDLVVCQQGLQFFSDRQAAVQEMRRVLKPDGRVVISVWQSLACHPVYETLFQATVRHLGVPISAVDVSFSFGDAQQLAQVLGDDGFHLIRLAARSLDVRLGSPELFVQLTVRGAATSVPTFARLGSESKSALVKAVSGEIKPILDHYRRGDKLSFPMHTNIAVAHVAPGREDGQPSVFGRRRR